MQFLSKSAESHPHTISEALDRGGKTKENQNVHIEMENVPNVLPKIVNGHTVSKN